MLGKNKEFKYFGNVYSRKTEPKSEWYQWIKTQVYLDSNIHFKRDRIDMQSAFMTTLFLRADVKNKTIPLIYIDLIDLDEYKEVLDVMKMGKFRVIHFRRENLVNLMVAKQKDKIIVNIQDAVAKMMLIEKTQEEFKKELNTRDIPVLDVTYEEKNIELRITKFLDLKTIKLKKFSKEKVPKDIIKNWDDFYKALQYTQFAYMV